MLQLRAIIAIGLFSLSSAFSAEIPAPSITAQDGAEMVLIPAGPFVCGSNNEPDERPIREVTLPAFYIDKYEVTHEQYAHYLKATGTKAPIDWHLGAMPPKLGRHPVVNISFNEAAAYARWAGKRLPTEMEWEKAARGSDGRIFPWGNTLTNKNIAAPLTDNSKTHTFPVGTFPDDTSPYGIMDMGGNVCEWTASWYKAYPGNQQLELEYGEKYRVIRGGGTIEYYGAPFSFRCSDRARSLPYGTYDGLGFRCVKDVK